MDLQGNVYRYFAADLDRAKRDVTPQQAIESVGQRLEGRAAIVSSMDASQVVTHPQSSTQGYITSEKVFTSARLTARSSM